MNRILNIVSLFASVVLVLEGRRALIATKFGAVHFIDVRNCYRS